MTKYAIIVAGGSGSRFGSAVPKQFLPLGGLPILMRSINRFVEADSSIRVILVLPHSQRSEWENLCGDYNFHADCAIVEGGGTRYESVKNALSAISPQAGDIIAVHDGVRPLASTALITRLYDAAVRFKAVIPAVAVTDTVRMVSGDGSSSQLDRSSLRAVQTPQVFDALTLTAAYELPFDPLFTDDASVVERSGNSIHLVDGDMANIKITHPADLMHAEQILAQQEKNNS